MGKHTKVASTMSTARALLALCIVAAACDAKLAFGRRSYSAGSGAASGSNTGGAPTPAPTPAATEAGGAQIVQVVTMSSPFTTSDIATYSASPYAAAVNFGYGKSIGIVDSSATVTAYKPRCCGHDGFSKSRPYRTEYRNFDCDRQPQAIQCCHLRQLDSSNCECCCNSDCDIDRRKHIWCLDQRCELVHSLQCGCDCPRTTLESIFASGGHKSLTLDLGHPACFCLALCILGLGMQEWVVLVSDGGLTLKSRVSNEGTSSLLTVGSGHILRP